MGVFDDIFAEKRRIGRNSPTPASQDQFRKGVRWVGVLSVHRKVKVRRKKSDALGRRNGTKFHDPVVLGPVPRSETRHRRVVRLVSEVDGAGLSPRSAVLGRGLCRVVSSSEPQEILLPLLWIGT